MTYNRRLEAINIINKRQLHNYTEITSKRYGGHRISNPRPACLSVSPLVQLGYIMPVSGYKFPLHIVILEYYCVIKVPPVSTSRSNWLHMLRETCFRAYF